MHATIEHQDTNCKSSILQALVAYKGKRFKFLIDFVYGYDGVAMIDQGIQQAAEGRLIQNLSGQGGYNSAALVAFRKCHLSQ